MNTTSEDKIIEIARNLIIDGSDNDPIIISGSANFEEENDSWLVIFEIDTYILPDTIFVQVKDKTHEAKIIPTL